MKMHNNPNNKMLNINSSRTNPSKQEHLEEERTDMTTDGQPRTDNNKQEQTKPNKDTQEQVREQVRVNTKAGTPRTRP